METPLRCRNRFFFETRERSDIGTESPPHFVAPETPFLKRLGYGTGVGVYRLDRTSVAGKSPKSPWAIKRVLRNHKDNTNYGKLLRQEAELLRKLNHPNVVGFRGFTKTPDGREVLAMEECTVSLGDMIEERREKNFGMFDADKIIKVCLNISKALDYLHNDVMLMHADIKSFNILINDDFKAVKLCDFGVSIKIDKNGQALEKYTGTSIWSAPEVLCDGKVTTKADIFSFGLVIYEMIALIPPHTQADEGNFSDSEFNDDDDDYDGGDDYVDDEENYGKRPNLPAVSFGENYSLILEIYNLCTEQNPDDRPSAKELIIKTEDKNY